MHDTALEFGKFFFEAYVSNAKNLVIVDIGSQDVNGSLRPLAPTNNKYVGVDFVKAEGVDIVISDPYSLPFESNSVDVCISSSCFEHSEFFWILFNETQRILKPSGIFYLNAPSNGNFHRYPVDCWRFYPDSGLALQNWARKSGYGTVLLESFIGKQKKDVWNDFVAVFLKDISYVSDYPFRIQHTFKNYTNGLTFESLGFSNYADFQEDQINCINLRKQVESLSSQITEIEQSHQKAQSYQENILRAEAQIELIKDLLIIGSGLEKL
jgi:SAM-dependent methyltransferase